jgi:hypothetical protein
VQFFEVSGELICAPPPHEELITIVLEVRVRGVFRALDDPGAIGGMFDDLPHVAPFPC